MYGEGVNPRKIKLKLLQLLYDLLVNDDSIINDGFHVRDALGKGKKLRCVEGLLDIIRGAADRFKFP